jgi:hypothetical protein
MFAAPFWDRNRRQEFGRQVFKLRRVLMVFRAICQTGISNRDRAAVGYPILQRVGAKYGDPGKYINRDVHQPLLVLAPISPP